MFGLIGKLTTLPGTRADVMEIIRASGASMPGCISYVIAADENDPDAIWITEVWESEAHHQASLQIPEVRATITKAMPSITGGETIARTIPLES